MGKQRSAFRPISVQHALQSQKHMTYRNTTRGGRASATGNMHIHVNLAKSRCIISQIRERTLQTDKQTDTLVTILRWLRARSGRLRSVNGAESGVYRD